MARMVNPAYEQDSENIPATTRIDRTAYDFYLKWAEREDRSLAQVLRWALERYHKQLRDASEAVGTMQSNSRDSNRSSV